MPAYENKQGKDVWRPEETLQNYLSSKNLGLRSNAKKFSLQTTLPLGSLRKQDVSFSI